MDRKRFWLGYGLGVVLALVFGALAIYQRFFRPPAISLRQLELVDMQGRPFSVTQLAGRPVVLNCWATWCVGCVAEFPDFERVKSQAGPSVCWLMVSDEPATKVAAFLKKHPQSFTFLRLKQPIRGLNVLPATYLFDQQGQLVDSHTGQLYAPELWQMLGNITR